MDESPEFSKIWKKRYDVFTPSTDNNIEKLNAEVEYIINMFKIRLIEESKKILIKELSENHPEKIQRDIAKRLAEMDQMRKYYANLTRTVITK